MIENIDLKDKKLLFELDLNSRQSVSNIAKKLRINKNTVNFRINRLVKEGYILGFYPVIDISRLGYFAFRVYFQFFNTTGKQEKEILDYLIDNKQCGVVAELEAFYDVMFMFITTNIYEFEKFWSKIKKKFRQCFWNEKIHFMTSATHLKRKYLSYKKESSFKEEKTGNQEKVKFDKKDLKILSQLARNCRISALEISQLTKIPARTIIYKIREMEKKEIIKDYRINLNLEKLGLEYYKINFKFDKMNQMDEITKFCEEHLNIIFIDYSISDYDFEIDFEVENKIQLMKIINEIKNKFPFIRSYEILTFKRYHKLEAIPRF